MKTLLFIALGGAIGSVARSLTGRISMSIFGVDFPWGTLIINVLGCFIMGLLAGLFAHVTHASQEVRGFLMVGVLGGFTTFSAFALDVVTLYERGALWPALGYLIVSVIFSILALVGGLLLIRTLST